MKKIRLLRNCARPIAVLWLVQLLVSAIVMAPVVEATPYAPDVELFESGGMMILEMVRLKQQQLMRALSLSSWFFVMGEILISIARFQLIRDVAADRFQRPPQLRGLHLAVAYGAMVVLIYLMWAFFSWLASVALRHFWTRMDGSLDPSKLPLALLCALLLVAGYLVMSVATDITRVALFRPQLTQPTPTRRELWLQQVFRTLRRHWPSLIGYRALRSVLTLVQSHVVFSMGMNAGQSTSWTGAWILIIVQCFVVLSLFAETLWWGLSAQKLGLQQCGAVT